MQAYVSTVNHFTVDSIPTPSGSSSAKYHTMFVYGDA